MGRHTAGLSGRALCVLSAVSAVALGTSVFVPPAYASVTVPRAPTQVAAAPGNGSAVVKWKAPVNNGGSAITGYLVRSTPGSKTCKTTGAKTCTIRGLKNGTNYTVTVKARNKEGLGTASVLARVKPGVPLAPRKARAAGGNARAKVTWTVPASNGSPISKYTVKSIPGSKTCTAHVTTCTVTGLSNGTPYRFKVSATNARGTGAASAFSNRVTPHLRATLTITASSGSQPFGGLAPTISAEYSGFVNGDTTADLTTLPTCVSGTTRSSPVGTYSSSCSGAVDPKYTIVYVGGTTTVNPATLTITASNGSQTFGGLLPTISAEYSGFVHGDTPVDLTALPTCVPGTTSSSPVLGNYLSSCAGAVDPNYTIDYVDGTTTVNPATLTITASSESQIFGGLMPTISAEYSGFVDGNTPADLTAMPTCVPGTTSSSPVGTYTSSCSGAAVPNYIIDYVDGSTTVTSHFLPTLTITASNGSQTFGGLVPTISPQYSGFVDGDTPSDLTTLPTCVPGTSSSSPVLGNYSSSCAGAVDSNYIIDYVDGTTTVNPAMLTITASDGSQTFGGLVPTISPRYAGFVDGDTPSDLTALPTCVPGTTSLSPVLGNYRSSCTGAVDPNYTIDYVDGTTTVNPAILTITANPEVKVVGTPDPAFTFVTVGLIGTGTTTGHLTRAPGEVPGVYAIEQGTLTAGPNYTIIYVGSFLTILL